MKYYHLFAPFLLSLASCVQHKQLVNFSEGPAFPAGAQPIAVVADVRIQPDDLLEIGVYAEDPVAVAPFTLQGIGARTKEENNVAGNNYLVRCATASPRQNTSSRKRFATILIEDYLTSFMDMQW